MDYPQPSTDEPSPTKHKRRPPSRIDLIAFFVSLSAFAFAATWPWLVQDNRQQEAGISITIEDESGRSGAEALGAAAADAAIGFASRVKERLKSKDDVTDDEAGDEEDSAAVFEEEAIEVQSPNDSSRKQASVKLDAERSIRDWLAPGTIMLGVFGIGLGGLSLAYGSSKALGIAAIGLGGAAVMIQILFILAAVIAGLILLMVLAPILAPFLEGFSI